MGRPIGAALQVGYRCQNIKRIATRRRHGRFGGCRAMQVEAEILRQMVVFEYVGQQRFIARAQQHHVMRHVFKTFVGAKVPNKKAHGILTLRDLGVGPHLAVLWVDQILIGPGRVGIANDDVSRNSFAGGQRDTTDPPLVDFDAANFCAGAQTAAHAFDHIHQAVDQSPGTAHGPVHAKASLQRIDEGINAGHGKRITANQQGLQAQGLAQLGVFDMGGDHPMQASPAFHADHSGHCLEQIAHTDK